MAHFPHHIRGGGSLVHGSPTAISQQGISSTGERVYISASRSRAGVQGTEVRLRPTGPSVPFAPPAAAVSIQDLAQVGCGSLTPGTIARITCDLLAGVIPGGGEGLVADKPCIPPFRRNAVGDCVAPFMGDQPGAEAGAAIMGQFGAALVPEQVGTVTLRCLPGMVLGRGNLCYNKRDIRNSDRKWPKGRKPLGTPGELAALAKAASFGRRMESTVKRMQKIGVLKKPKGRSAPRRPAMRQIAPGPSIINVE